MVALGVCNIDGALRSLPLDQRLIIHKHPVSQSILSKSGSTLRLKVESDATVKTKLTLYPADANVLR